MFTMNRMPLAKRAQIIGLLVEGNSLRAASRLADCSINTATKLLIDVGMACAEYQDQALRNLPCKRIQCDEIWAFCYSKARNVPEDKKGVFGYGDVWTWTALCADTKLMAGWLVGSRDRESAQAFMADLAGRLANRVQLTSDGHHTYLDAVENAFGKDIDFAMLVKNYSDTVMGPERRYSPSDYKSAIKKKITGNPDMSQVSTSYVERQNLKASPKAFVKCAFLLSALHHLTNLLARHGAL